MATAPRFLESFNPANGELVGSVPTSGAEEVTGAIARARGAQGAWEGLGLKGRAGIIAKAGPLFLAKAEELGLLLSKEMGKPLREAIGEAKACGAYLDEELAEMVQALTTQVLVDAHTETELIYDAFGVCAAISPWNFPLSMPHCMVIPALMAGNSVILKPSEETPLVAQAYVDTLNEVLPPGVLGIIHGDGEQGRALVAGDVDLIAFTGSKATGARILEAAAPHLKRVILELGGKDPLVVLEDADLAKAARFAARNSFRNAGQVCVSTERIYVHESIAAEFEGRLVEEAKAMVVGVGTDPDVKVGPMVNGKQRDIVLGQVARAIEDGATRVCGGALEGGNFIVPIVLTGVDHTMEIMSEETFGPVACVMSVSSDDEAVALANDTPFGLGAVVFGEDVERAKGVARRIKAGMVGINRGVGGASGSPWVGAKESGYGFHGGPQGHRQFAQTRIVSVRR